MRSLKFPASSSGYILRLLAHVFSEPEILLRTVAGGSGGCYVGDQLAGYV